MKRVSSFSLSPAPLLPFGIAAVLMGCTMNPMKVGEERVERAQRAYSPIDQQLDRGPAAEAYFQKKWTFVKPGGVSFDPTEVEVREGSLRLRALPKQRDPASAIVRDGAREVVVAEITQGRPFVALRSFGLKTGPQHQGVVQFQLSNDGSRWFFHDGKTWKPGVRTIRESNTAPQVHQAIRTFHQEVGGGRLFLKVFMQTPTGNEKIEIQEISVEGLSPSVG